VNIDFKLPELGENIHSGDVVNLLVKEGDQIAANSGLFELETDKAVVEIPCPYTGLVAKLHAKKGDTIKVGQVVATITSGDEAKPAATAAPSAPASAAPVPAPAKAAPTPPPQPAAQPAAAPAAAAPKPPPAAPAPTAPARATPAAVDRTGPIPAGPAVRRMAREQGVDLSTIAGSGKYGRITPEDVAAAAGHSPATYAPATPAPAEPTAAAAPAPAPAVTGLQPAASPGESATDAWGPVRVEKMSRIRRTIAEQMVRSATTIPHVTNFDDADVTELERLRQGVPAAQLGQNIKLTMMPFVMRAVAMALRRHATLNAVFDQANEQIVYKDYVNLGVAVDTARGLVVPNIRGADRLTIVQLAQALASIAERARGGQFAIEDLRGGTFTISNLGAVGGQYSTPIINYPEVAILLLGRARWLPVVRGENHDRLEHRLMMPLSLSYDHRLVDGATAGRFLNEVIRNLETPGMLLLA
jgi:pyruvate/2-oxoglutarate dehydrogenase complex dihydrolipoamide acyltransferase (E2) component